jgi:DNA primase
MSVPPAFLDELRRRHILSELVAKRVKLIPAGRGELKGLCPFHNEKTPSFYVVDAKEFFHCFGCGASGDTIAWIERTENLDFIEAVERLAELAGLEVPRRSPEERKQYEREANLHDVLEGAALWFERRMKPGTKAWEYLCGRGLDEVTIRKYRLGWAPDEWHELQLAFKAGDDQQLLEAGLIAKHQEKGVLYDFFRGRVMFPIADRRGRVIAFSGRTLSATEDRKYLNSPESLLFKKRETLYGIASARAASLEKPAPTDGAARRFAEAILVVEGPMDAIALHRVGLPAVATLGTAMTAEHLHELWRSWAEPICCFDGDAAGTAAAKRVLKLALPLLQPERSLFFARLPAGEDPDSLIRSQGRAAIDRVVSAATPLSRFLFRIEAALHPNDTPERAAGLRARLAADCAIIKNTAVRTEYLNFFSRALDAPQTPVAAIADTRPRLEALFRLIAAVPDLVPDIADELADLDLATAPDLARLRDAMLAGADWRDQLYNGLAAAAEAVLLPALGVGLIDRDRARAEARRLLATI